jgi:hypothetical protein
MTKLERKIIYALPIVSICFEILKSFMLGSDFPIMSVRNYLFVLIILFLLVKYFKYVFEFNIFLVTIIVYFLVILIARQGEISDYNDWIQFIDAKMLLPLAFIFTTSYTHIQELHKNFLITNILFVGSILIFSIFGIGIDQYGSASGFRSGAFEYSAIYIGSYLLLTYPLQFQDLKTRFAKNALIVLGVLTLIVLVLSVRRSALVILFIGVVVYVYLYRAHIGRIALYGFGFFVLLVLAFPLYRDTLEKQIAARGDVFNEKGVAENLQEETRLAETIAVYEERILTPEVTIFLFGDHLFDSSGNYAGGVHGQRPLHLDVNIILHGAGMIGLILFLMIYVQLFTKFATLKTTLNLPNEKNFTAAFIAMFLSHLFLLISGGMITMTFNMISSLYMGGILGLYRSAHLGTLPPYNSTQKLLAAKSVQAKPLQEKSKPYVYEVIASKQTNG